MAEIQSDQSSQKVGKRLNKKSARVDLTPMVDLGFLLLTFFVFTTTMALPTTMNVDMPNDKIPDIKNEVCESCALTFVLEKDNKIRYYEGDLAKHPKVTMVDFSSTTVRDLIEKKKDAVQRLRGDRDEMQVIIKPSKESSFKNFVDIIDEMTISEVKRYFIDELSEGDKELMRN